MLCLGATRYCLELLYKYTYYVLEYVHIYIQMIGQLLKNISYREQENGCFFMKVLFWCVYNWVPHILLIFNTSSIYSELRIVIQSDHTIHPQTLANKLVFLFHYACSNINIKSPLKTHFWLQESRLRETA